MFEGSTVVEPERAIFLHNLDTLPEGFSRLYFGSEFCPWTFPEADTILEAIESSRRSGWHFTLSTPVITEPFLPHLTDTLTKVLPALEDEDEILVSDIGGIALVRRIAPRISILLGRALSGQKRGPRILDLELSADQINYFRKGSWYSEGGRGLLAELSIDRVELDNLLQGISPLPDGVRGSLHYPFAMVTSSRNCPCRDTNPSAGCPVFCREAFTLNTPQTSVPLFQAGNTQFLRNDRLPADLSALGIDRLVFHPALPR